MGKKLGVLPNVSVPSEQSFGLCCLIPTCSRWGMLTRVLPAPLSWCRYL